MKLRYWIIILLFISALISLFIFLGNRDDGSKFEIEVAQRHDIVQEVSLTGHIKPAQRVDLAFEKSGRVSRVLVDVGGQVLAGDILVGLTNQELSAQFLRNQAILEAEKTRLDELERGTRLEEIKLQEARVADSQLALQNARQSLINNLQESFTKTDDAIRNGLDRILDHPQGLTPRVSFIANNAALEERVQTDRHAVGIMLADWQESLATLNNVSDLQFYFNEAQINLVQVKDILGAASILTGGASTSLNPSISQSTINSWQSAISAARTNINNGISGLITASERFEDAGANLNITDQELFLKQAGATKEQISVQKSKVKQVLSDLNNAQAQLTKAILRSPISGTVIRQDAKVGQLATASSILVSVISSEDFKIEANVPEADIIKVKIGNKARVTLDAYGPDIIFEAQVIKIDPAETVIDGVITYKVTFSMDISGIFFKSGMTANIDLITAELKKVIAIPQRAVFTKDGQRWVKLLVNGKEQEVPVVVGVVGHNGLVEIKSGIREGDQVITFTKD